jgi:vancomycin resistance protein VanW
MIDTNSIQAHINSILVPKRQAFSLRYPWSKTAIIFLKKLFRSTKNFLTLPKLKKGKYFDNVIARHSSLLFRKLGDSDPQLQINKITNLKIAISKLDGLIIPGGKTFSLWDNVGSISKSKGYVDGMILSNGTVSKGLGGGLCQLSNFLVWIFLHADTKIVERHHHSIDVFPDSGRTLPFGSGATIYYNYVDLKIKNNSKNDIQLKLWLTDDCLKGQLLSNSSAEFKYHIIEKDHCFIHQGGKYYRYNEIFREILLNGDVLGEEKIFTNFAPVMYQVDENKLRELGYKLVNL